MKSSTSMIHQHEVRFRTTKKIRSRGEVGVRGKGRVVVVNRFRFRLRLSLGVGLVSNQFSGSTGGVRYSTRKYPRLILIQ
jgi:hypothetical protein